MNENIRISTYQIGARNGYMVPSTFKKFDMLNRLYTDLWFDPSILNIKKILNKTFFRDLMIRHNPLIPKNLVVSFPVIGSLFALSKRVIFKNSIDIRTRANILMAEVFGEKVSKLLKNDKSNLTYGFAFESPEILEENSNKLKIIDQCDCSNYYYRTYLDECKKWDGWEPTESIDVNILNRRVERDRVAWKLSDKIIAPSTFVMDYLISEGASREKITILPYAHHNNKIPRVRVYDKERKLRILYLGAINLMKGIPYLLAGLDLLESNKVEIKLVGPIFIRDNVISKWRKRYSFTGKVPQNNVSDYYDWADVFIFPSLCEGSANVVYEALSFGLPVITTPNSGSVITDNLDGLIIEPKDSNALVSAIGILIDNPEIISEMSRQAIKTAEKFSINSYSRKLFDIVTEMLN